MGYFHHNDGAGVQVIDWEHLRVDQDYDWQRLHEGVLAAARSRSPETATFFNNRVLPQGDISYAEIAELCEISEGTVAATLARAHADLAKALTREGARP